MATRRLGCHVFPNVWPLLPLSKWTEQTAKVRAVGSSIWLMELVMSGLIWTMLLPGEPVGNGMEIVV